MEPKIKIRSITREKIEEDFLASVFGKFFIEVTSLAFFSVRFFKEVL
jgi:hypothetical protein